MLLSNNQQLKRVNFLSLRVLWVLFILTYCPSLLTAQINTYTDADRLKMRKEADLLVSRYVFNLNSIGNTTNEVLRNDDINKTLETTFESSTVPIYDDLSRSNQGKVNLSARDYLERIYKYYPNGIKFEYSTNLKNPCYKRIDDKNFYEVKVEVFKKIEGIMFTDNAMNINKDSIDIYVKFPILQNRPTLKTGPGVIYKIVLHAETVCEEIEGTRRPPLTDFENDWVRQRAEIFLEDFALTLNIIGNPNINERYNTLDYFEKNEVVVYNDLAPHFRLKDFVAKDYLEYIELWFQQGVRFNYRKIKATNVLQEPNYVSVEVEVDRVMKVPEESFRDHQSIKVFVRFPFTEDGTVGLERSTPRIYRIEEKARKTNDKNYLAVGLQLNAVDYFGDLNPVNSRFKPEWGLTRLGVGVHAIKKLNSFIFLRGSLAFGRLVGDDNTAADPNDNLSRFRYLRNLHFRNNITEFALTAIVDLRPNKGLFYRRNSITPYLFAGIGVAFHNPEARGPGILRNNWFELAKLPIGTEGQGLPGYPDKYSLVQPVIPFGLGFKFRLDYRWDLGLEVGLRYTFTDYLDDVSGFYPDPGDFGEENFLSYQFSNRTLETTSAFSGNTRQEELERVLNSTGLGIITFTGSDGNPYQTVNGYGRLGEQRGGNKVDDLYLFTGFHITYLLNVGRPRAPMQRIPQYQYDF